MTPERLKEIRRRFSRDRTSLWLKEHGGMLDAIDDLLAHVDALEKAADGWHGDPLTVRSHLAVRKRDMKVFDCDAAERLAVLVLDMGPPKDDIDVEARELALRLLPEDE